MALFELENGRLVPAQFGRDVPEGFTPDVLAAIRAQVLEIVSRPLFPIKWSAWDSEHPKQHNSRLTALDASGQVVAVEVMRVLDADVLIDSLSRLADTASMSWSDLAREYPLGPAGFKNEWVHFREAMPPSPPNGPRLVIATSQISDDVRPALDVLSSSGVEVHQMSLRQMANGRAFLEVDVVGPRLYGHRANTLLETSAVLPVLTESAEAAPAPRQGTRPVPPAPKAVPPGAARPEIAAQPEPAARPQRSARRETTPPAGAVRRTVPATTTTLPSRRAARPTASPSASFPTRRSLARLGATQMPSRRRADSAPHSAHAQGAKHGVAPQAFAAGSDAQKAQLRKIAVAAGGSVPIFLKGANSPVGASLSADGAIVVRSGRYADPSKALEAEGFVGVDGWTSWRIGSAAGPTLLEALTEISV